METYYFVWVLAGITGLTASGLIGSGWAMLTGGKPSIWLLSRYSVAMPFIVFALVGYAPLAVTKAGLQDIDNNPVFGMMLLATGLLWSFLQGVFILTTFFGFT
jgi:hypothetical protein